MSADNKQRIRELNDALRKEGEGGSVVATYGVQQLPGEGLTKALQLVKSGSVRNTGKKL